MMGMLTRGVNKKNDFFDEKAIRASLQSDAMFKMVSTAAIKGIVSSVFT
jgi:hypothetical protein